MRLLDYGVSLTILKYGDCASYNGRIKRMLDYRGIGLARFHCTHIQLTYIFAVVTSATTRVDR